MTLILFDCLQKDVLACFWLSYTVFSTIFLRTTFATFPYISNMCTLLFAWFYSKQRFCLCLAKLQRFCYLLARLRFFQHHLSENNVSFFFCYQTALVNIMLLSVSSHQKCFASFAVKLGIFQHDCSGKWISFPIFNGWRWFLLDGTQKNVLACFWLSYAVLSIISLTTTFTTFSYMKYVFDALTYQNIFWFVCSEFELIWAFCLSVCFR